MKNKHNNLDNWSAVHYDMVKESFDYFGIDNSLIHSIMNRWGEKHRFYHGYDHLIFILDKIRDRFVRDTVLSRILTAAAVFHDAVYEIEKTDNEDQSAELFMSLATKNIVNAKKVRAIIMDSKHDVEPSFDLSSVFCEYDLWNIKFGTLSDLIENEEKIFKEYQRFDYTDYISGRRAIMKKIGEKTSNPNFKPYLDYLESKKINIGVYPGSFNPFHVGHMNILEKAEKIFDKVIVAVGKNTAKVYASPDIIALDSQKEIKKALNFRQVDSYTGLLTDYLKSKKYDCTIIRGIRNGTDLEYEHTQMTYLKKIKDDISVVYIPCDTEFEHVSSSGIRQLSSLDQNEANKYLIL